MALPTETVYGLGAAPAEDGPACRIYEVKKRDPDKASAVHGHRHGDGGEVLPEHPPGQRLPPGGEVLARPADHDPGGQRGGVPRHHWGGDTLGVRCPNHPVTLALIEEGGVALAAPSANPAGQPSPKTAQEVLDYFDGHMEGSSTAAPVPWGVESTIVDRLLRPGGLPMEDLEEVLGEVELDEAVTRQMGEGGNPGPRNEIPPLCPSAPVTVVTGTPKNPPSISVPS